MARLPNLKDMSYAQLVDLRSKLDTLIVEREREEKAEVKRKLQALAAQSGFDVTELFGARRGRRGGSVAVKYRNPKDSTQTWSGRGRKPKWLTEAEAKGRKIAEFAV